MNNEKILVVYHSKTGYTQKYAKWISEELRCELKDCKKLKLQDLEGYDTIIFGGRIFASQISGLGLIKNNFAALKNKKLIVFATGLTNPGEDDLQKMWAQNTTVEQREYIRFFYFRGGFDYSKLGLMSKMIMSMMKSKLKKEENPTEDTKEMLAAMEHPVDYTDKSKIEPLIVYVRK